MYKILKTTIFTFLLFIYFLLGSFFASGQQTMLIGDYENNEIALHYLDGERIKRIDRVNTPQGVTNDDSYIFYLNRDEGQLRRYNTYTDLAQIIYYGLDDPTDIVAILDLNILILVERSGKISKIDYNGENYEVITEIISSPIRISFDHIEKLLFVSSANGIYSINLVTQDVNLVTSQVERVVAIEVDPRTKQIYFSERGSRFGVSRINYDGTERVQLIDRELYFTYFELDCSGDRMFFTASQDNLYGYFDLEGNNFQTFGAGFSNVACLDLIDNSCEQITNNYEIDNNEDVLIYPIPSNGSLYIDAIAQFEYYELFDISGILIDRVQIDSDNAQLSLDSPGIYFLKLCNNNQSLIKKVIRY